MSLEEIYLVARHSTFAEFKNTVNERFGVPSTVESNKKYELVEIITKPQEVTGLIRGCKHESWRIESNILDYVRVCNKCNQTLYGS